MASQTTLDCITLDRDGERYIFIYLPSKKRELAMVCGRYAVDPELSFNWKDAQTVMFSTFLAQKKPSTVVGGGRG